MQLPFSPGIVHIWMLQDENGWFFVDAGLNTPEGRTELAEILVDFGRPEIASVIVTHAHADHGGLAGWLCRETGATLMMSRVEWLQARMMQLNLNQDLATHERFFRMAGIPNAWLAQVVDHRNWMASQFAELPPTFQRIAHGDVLTIGSRDWTVLTGGGHSSEQVALYCASEGILIGADHILPRIIPAITARPEEFLSDPFQEAFASLQIISLLPEATWVLPSHGEPFHGVHARAAAVLKGYRKRLDRIRDFVSAPTNAYECLSLIPSREMSFRSMRIPVAEAFASLRHLELRGDLTSRWHDDGVLRFAPSRGR